VTPTLVACHHKVVHTNGTRKNRRALVPHGFSENFVTIDGHRMRYLIGGRGPKLLLIHGLMGYSISWSEIAADLASSFAVFAPDMLNLGLSDRADIEPSLHAMAARMWRFADAVGVGRAIVLGTSQGGAIAMKMAALAPERVDSLILVSPAHPWSEKARWQIRLFSSPMGVPLAWAMSLAPRLWMALGLYRLYGDSAKMPAGTIPGYSRVIDHRMLRYLLRVARRWYLDFETLKDELSRFADIPTLLIWGDRDCIVPPTTASELEKQFRHVTLEVVRGAGHLPYEEAPQDFLAALARGRRTLRRNLV
jgi:pimeloyl-ACP methyl ester carboxylesterase